MKIDFVPSPQHKGTNYTIKSGNGGQARVLMSEELYKFISKNPLHSVIDMMMVYAVNALEEELEDKKPKAKSKNVSRVSMPEL